MSTDNPADDAPNGIGEERVQEGIPATRRERDRIREIVREYVSSKTLSPPLTFNELHDMAGEVIRLAGVDEVYRDWVTVLVNNASWAEEMARIPCDRRLLLLPQCLRDKSQCRGKMDELGLLCAECGRCGNTTFKREAERLGYVVLISEGTAAVLTMVQSGQVEAFIGSSCMSTLRKVFPVVSLVGVPAFAIPLLRDGCECTAVDEDWLLEAMRSGDAVAVEGSD